MATVTSSEVGTDDVAVDRGGTIVTSATYTFATSGDGTATGDIIQMCKVPAGARIVDVILAVDDLDTDGSPTIEFDVGDGDDVDRYIDGATTARTGGVIRMNSQVGADKVYTAEDTIDIKVVAAATAKAAGDAILTVIYVTTAGTGGSG